MAKEEIIIKKLEVTGQIVTAAFHRASSRSSQKETIEMTKAVYQALTEAIAENDQGASL